ncbi:MAG: hypothetical protein BXU00_00370 [Candidatus Nanoclepta minutus]|uniref:Uncharacterized protein n=1 Tax=Candidatus Nanoclepta minutus TaxID=1940235 RepID=A0A397WNA3_9ARCH|nr:MAG: hypothetical protein BXU00_00370 [Candidatus Nanoclepta minutus]
MDIGEMLNILLAVFVILISIFLALELPYLSLKYSTNSNPFAIYHVAVSLDYFSSFPGNFYVKIDYPGIENVEFRISSYKIQNNLITGNSYVSEGICNIKNHLEDIAFDIITSVMFAFSPIKLEGEGAVKSATEAIIKTLIEASRVYAIGEILSLGFTAFGYIASGNFMDAFRNFVLRVNRDSIGYFRDIVIEKGTQFTETAGRMIVSTVIRLILKSLNVMGPWGWVISFTANLAISLADNVYSLVRGNSDVEYNCLKGIVGTTQYVYVEFNRIDFSQNLYVPIEFQYVIKDDLVLSRVEGGWLYKVYTMDESTDKYYILNYFEISKDRERIFVRPIYSEIAKSK